MERTGISPAERPTEWTTAVVMLITAALAWRTDHDTAALVAVVALVLPVIVTALASWYDRRHLPPAPTPTVGTAPVEGTTVTGGGE
jgi:amino acid transporter